MPLSKCVSASYTGRTLYGHAYLQHCCGAHHILINQFHWIVPLWVNTWTPSHTLARPSHILQKNRQNDTERKSSKAINFPFENDDFFTFKDDTNEFTRSCGKTSYRLMHRGRGTVAILPLPQYQRLNTESHENMSQTGGTVQPQHNNQTQQPSLLSKPQPSGGIMEGRNVLTHNGTSQAI